MMIALLAAGVVYVVFLWWFSTGAILWLDRRPKVTYRWSLIAVTVIAAVAGCGLAASLRDATPFGAVIAFTCALAIWGWHELTFLTGLISGPQRTACPSDVPGWRRFILATSTLIYHEIALLLTALVIAAVSWQAPNQFACWTFLVLFFSRLSAKLNLFFGVPNFSDELFPDHLRYLSSYLRRSPASALFSGLYFGGRRPRRHVGRAGAGPWSEDVRGHRICIAVCPRDIGSHRARLHGSSFARCGALAMGSAGAKRGRDALVSSTTLHTPPDHATGCNLFRPRKTTTTETMGVKRHGL